MAIRKVGRPQKQPDERLAVVSIRLSPEQAALLKKLGGSRWIREQLNAAMRRKNEGERDETQKY